MDSTEERGLAKRPRSLDIIGRELRAEVAAAEVAFKSTVGHAIRAGELLIEAKDQLDHGDWLRWLRANFSYSERTAHNWMRVARESATVADFPTLRDAIKAATKPRWREGTPLADQYVEPPFTVLDARRGDWQDRRKNLVTALGIQSEVGRAGDLTFGAFSNPDFGTDTIDRYGEGSTSIFDPALCEVIYNWLVPPGGTVLDPFAGGSVRGMVAAFAGLRYVGIELRQEQVDANRQQARAAEQLWADDDELPRWVAGDSAVILGDPEAHDIPMADLVFTSPPWGNSERYSREPADLSNMAPDDFETAYRNILTRAVDRLHDDRFACVAIGNIRDRTGHIRDLVGLTHAVMADAGAPLYNEAVLLNSGGSARLRARQFTESRKLVGVHQPLPMYVKGDARKAAALIEGAAF